MAYDGGALLGDVMSTLYCMKLYVTAKMVGPFSDIFGRRDGLCN